MSAPSAVPTGTHKRAGFHFDLETIRPVAAAGAAVLAVLFILLMHFTLPDKAAKILLDRGGLIYPFSVQNGMWIMFFIALAELGIRFVAGTDEAREIARGYLPEDSRTILQASDLSAILRRVRAQPGAMRCFLPRLIDRCILQFQASRSTEQSALLLNTSMDMFIHEVDLRYNMLRYITWLIPSLGFIGTVVGIGHALSYAGEPGRIEEPTLLTELTSRLAVAFDGTLVALLLAAILVFLQNVAQSREEHALNRAGQYCLDNLINRLYEQ